jgi:glycosyltransferase involved in cell wall biosynthesis
MPTDRSAMDDGALGDSRSTLVISVYPLNVTYKQQLVELAGGRLVYTSLSQVRLLNPLAAIRAIRAQTARRCFIALEESSSYALLAILQVMAMLSRARHIEIVHPDLRREPVSRWRSLAPLVGVFLATIDGVRAGRSHRKAIRQLVSQPRAAMELRPTRSVLYVNPNMWFSLRVGGAVSHITGVVNAFSELGHDVDVASVSPFALRGAARSLRLTPPRHFGIPEESNYFRFQREILDQLHGFTNSGDYGFIYQRMSVHNFVGVLLSRLARLPLVLEYNGSEVWAARNWGRPLRAYQLASAAEDVCLRHAHLVVTVSEVLREEVIARGVIPERVVMCPNGFDPDLFAPERFSPKDVAACRARFHIPPSAIVATFVGTFGKWHGVDVLARLIRRLVSEDAEWLRNLQMRFLLVGDGSRMGEIRQIVGDASESVAILPGLLPKDDIPVLLAASDILLAPHVANVDGTEFFGSPTKLFEYMGMGRAIVASKLGQIADVLSPSLSVGEWNERRDSGYLAVLVAPGNERELETAIRFLAENPTWRDRLGASARERALERHTWQSHVRAILDALHRLQLNRM